MNRPGQQQQRPPNLGPTPAMGGFRGPYQQAYGLPPRGVMQAYQPSLQNHRAAQSLVPQASPGFIQQRGSVGASSFGFGGSMQQQQQPPQQQQQQQPQSTLQQQQQHPQPLPQPQPQPQSQNSSSGTGVPPHLAQTQNSGGGEVGLDPNDFPALGSGNTPTAPPASAGLHSSYATQAGTPSSGAGASTAQGARDFGPDDFPALGVQAQTQQSQDAASATTQPQQQQHPPGINGFQADQQTHRQTLLGTMTGQQHGLLGQQQPARNLHSGYEAEKRNFTKLNQNQNWPSNNAQQQQHAPAFPPNLTNGAPSQQQQQQSQHILQPQTQSGQQQQQTQHLNAPPGVPPPSTYTHQQQQYVTPASQTETHPPSHPLSQQPAHPQTPAQQLLMSPADRWGLLGLLALIKSADPDLALLSIGADLANLGLNVGQEGNIYSNFITPWSDSTAAATVEPEFHLPACYNVQPPPPGPTKAAAFSDETLFFMFYSSPRDGLQEVAAQELWNRNWRWHKELRHWLTKETGTSPSQKVPGGEAGTYTFWDPESWSKERKELTVLYADLEEKSIPAFVQGPGLQPHPQHQMQQRGGYQATTMGIVAGMA